MSWRLNLLKDNFNGYGLPKEPKVGDCWYFPFTGEKRIGSTYHTKYADKRQLIAIWMPGEWVWVPDSMAYSTELGYHGNGWKVEGLLPLITCSPSINAFGTYHGFVIDGSITDDCEGRKF